MEEEKVMKKVKENYLDKIPQRNETFSWYKDENGTVTIEVENKGIFNRIAQKLLKKPKVTKVHLDENGSFIWPLLDGDLTVSEIGEKVGEHFGEKANPLYERLIKYLGILESYSFIKWK